ncbi:MAG: PqqD family peptide modification chaperone [Victivallales bacterium]|nr:PqqD family peptide modification chaperone [Victivallales bacterium]
MNLNPNIVFRKEFDGTGLFYNPDNGQTFYLNKTSRIICEGLEQGLDNAGIIARFREKVDGVPDDIDKVIDEFIGQLRERGIVEDKG